MSADRRASDRTLQTALKMGALCAASAGCALLVIFGVMALMESRAPLVDLDQRDSAALPLHSPATEKNDLRFAVAAMVSAEATFSTYRQLVSRIGRDVGREEVFVLRPSYADVRRELEQGNVDVAFVCTGTYVHAMPRRSIKLLVQPEFESGLEYRSLLIVPAKSSTQKLLDLRGAVMAFTDPESNTGCIVPSASLVRLGHTPKKFFRKVVFTGSHDRSIQAVATGTVDAAAVDSLVWVSNLRSTPALAARVRIIWQSQAFGPPPVVVPVSVSPQLHRSLQEAFLGLDKDPAGRSILSEIGIKRFVKPKPDDYRTAADLFELTRSEQGGSR